MLLAILRTMRPHQWTKNLVLLAAIVFSLNFLDPRLLVLSLEGVAVFCLLSGGVYLLNDLKDREKDRLHPAKKSRPIASGALPTGAALVALIVVIVAAVLSASPAAAIRSRSDTVARPIWMRSGANLNGARPGTAAFHRPTRLPRPPPCAPADWPHYLPA